MNHPRTVWLRARKKGLWAILSLLLLMTLFCSGPVSYAADWPSDLSIEAEGGILMDADSGTILYEKNSHEPYYPASITKILTALIVIERCSLDEMVTFSHDAVYNVEAGSSSAGLDEGDVISVRDCLYALLLKSANESANALAEHVAGSREAFAELMNEKAASLGCEDSHFANPSGLNDPDHYVSAYDMALIGRAALQNPVFMEIDSTLYYDLPATKKNPGGGRIYPGHKMLKKNCAEYYAGCLGGKTGFTSLAGNTLVTFAERNGMTLVAVVLNGHQTHYSDTKAMLDWGFSRFRTCKASEIVSPYASLDNDMKIGELPAGEFLGLQIEEGAMLTLPKEGDFGLPETWISFTGEDLPAGALAVITYTLEGKKIGQAYVTRQLADGSRLPQAPEPTPLLEASEAGESEPAAGTAETAETESVRTEKKAISLPEIPLQGKIGAGMAAAVLAGLLLFRLIRRRIDRKEEEERLARRQKRLERLEKAGISSASFEYMLEEKRKRSREEKKTKDGQADQLRS